MQNEINLETLNPEQRAALREMLLPQVNLWRAQDSLKDAKRRNESKQSALASERRGFTEVEQVEQRNMEARLAKQRGPLTVAEAEAAEAAQVLAEAQAALTEAEQVAAEADHAVR